MEPEAVASRTRARCRDSPEKQVCHTGRRTDAPCDSAGRSNSKRTAWVAGTASSLPDGHQTSKNTTTNANGGESYDSKGKDDGDSTALRARSGQPVRAPSPAPSSSDSDVVIVDEVQAADCTLLCERHAKRQRRGDARGSNGAGGVVVKKSNSDNEADELGDDEDLRIVGVVGQVATRDLPHPRPDCAEHRFVLEGAASNRRRCSQCYCYVCDVRATECEFWGTGGRSRDHANARPHPAWSYLRQAARAGNTSLVRQEFAAAEPLQLPSAPTLQLQPQGGGLGGSFIGRGRGPQSAPQLRGAGGARAALGVDAWGLEPVDADAFLAALTMFVAAAGRWGEGPTQPRSVGGGAAAWQPRRSPFQADALPQQQLPGAGQQVARPVALMALPRLASPPGLVSPYARPAAPATAAPPALVSNYARPAAHAGGHLHQHYPLRQHTMQGPRDQQYPMRIQLGPPPGHLPHLRTVPRLPLVTHSQYQTMQAQQPQQQLQQQQHPQQQQQQQQQHPQQQQQQQHPQQQQQQQQQHPQQQQQQQHPQPQQQQPQQQQQQPARHIAAPPILGVRPRVTSRASAGLMLYPILPQR